MIDIINTIENDESLRKWFIVGFKRLTKIHNLSDIKSMVNYLHSVCQFPLSMMLPIAHAYHTLNSMIVYTDNKRLVYNV